jgi:hypothetical protein
VEDLVADDENELDRLDPQPVSHKLSTGLSVDIVRLRTRQFFRLLRVLTHGVGPAMVQAGLDFTGDAAKFTSQLLTLVVMAIPDAEQEAISFLQAMCKPSGLADRPDSQLSKADKAANDALWEQFNKDLFNPELEDLIDLLELIVRQEAPELQALGKKLERVFKLFRATGQDKEDPEPEPTQEELAASSGSSPAPSTSSAPSTDGPTSTSSASRSAGSGKSAKRREPEPSPSS